MPAPFPVTVSRIQNRRGTQVQFDALYPAGYTGMGGYGNPPSFTPAAYPNVLLPGELALCEDTLKVYVGLADGKYFQLGTSSSSTGTVTSIGVSGGSTGLTTTGGPVTTSGTITLGGILDLDNGGTGASTREAAINNLLPIQGGQTGKYLRTTGSIVYWDTVSGTGSVTSVDVSGGTTGLTTSGGPITGSGTITLAGRLNIANGGTGAVNAQSALNNLLPSQTGKNGYILSTNGASPYWMGAPETGDPHWSKVAWLITGNGTNGSNTIVDSGPNALTFTTDWGNFQYTTSQGKYYPTSVIGSKPGALTTTIPSDPTNASWTIELWFRATAGAISNSDAGFGILQTEDGNVCLRTNGPANGGNNRVVLSGTGVFISSTSPILPDTWTYITLSFENLSPPPASPRGTLRIFINGVLESTLLDQGFYWGPQKVYIGPNSPPRFSSAEYNFSDYRFTQGVARYTSSFTPPTEPLPIGGLVAGPMTFVNSFSGGTTGLLPNTPTTGRIQLSGILNVSNGGTGGNTVPTAAAALQGTGLETNSVGFRGIPINFQSTDYTTVASDAGKTILHPETDTTSRTFTIPSNSSVAYPIGTAITFINDSSADLNISVVSDTLVQAGTGFTGNRILIQYGIATAVKISATKWYISGTNLE